MILVYTCNFNDYDEPPPAPLAISPDAEYIYLTDVKSADPPPPWQRHDRHPYDPKGYSRLIKIHNYPSVISIYHDCSLQMVHEPEYYIEFLQRDKTDLAIYAHPKHTSLEQERDEILKWNLAPAEKLQWEIDFARLVGVPDLPGVIYAGGVLVRRNTTHTKVFQDIWWSLFLKGSGRDQMSLPTALQMSQIPFTVLPGQMPGPDTFIYLGHKRP